MEDHKKDMLSFIAAILTAGSSKSPAQAVDGAMQIIAEVEKRFPKLPARNPTEL